MDMSRHVGDGNGDLLNARRRTDHPVGQVAPGALVYRHAALQVGQLEVL